MPTKQRKAYRAIAGFAPADAGYRVVREGELVFDDDPVMEGRMHLFQPVDDFVEQTTQAPGERRAVSPPKEL